MSAIEVRNLVKRYRGNAANAVDHVSFDVADGQLFCLLGPNGAGKTTTVSILTTTLTPTSGRVRIAGRDLGGEPSAVRRELGIVFQQPSLDLNRHCCIEPEGVGEPQPSGGSPHPKSEKKGSNHSIVAMSCRV
jgi:ABC-type multidrug transport system ATPase subunit